MKLGTRFSKLIFVAIAGLASFSVHAGHANFVGTYNVTVTNITHGEIFTPLLVATHKAGTHIFALGSPASSELATMAEGGDTGPLSEMLMASGNTFDIGSNGGLLRPGESTTVTVKMKSDFNYITVASMLIPTNDAFMSIHNIQGPSRLNHPMTIMVPAYDAGSELNDELCAHIPGPDCGGVGGSPDEGGEGFVSIHRGIQGIGDLTSSGYDWRNPVAQIVITRTR